MALNGLVVPQWISLVLSELRRAEFVDFVLVIIVPSPARRRWSRERFRGLLFSIYESVDYRAFRSPPDAFKLADDASTLRQELTLLSVPSDSADLLAESDLELVRSLDLDVVLWLAETAPRRELLQCPRRGVWRLRHGEPALYRDGPPFFWELFDRQTVSTTVLEECSDRRDRQPKQIYSSRSAIHPQSLYKSRNSPYWKAARFMLRCLKQLALEGDATLERPSTHRPAGTIKTKPRGLPSNAQMLFFLIGLFTRGTRSRLRRALFREHWFLAYRPNRRLESATGQESYAVDMQGFTIVSPPRGRSAADPFILSKGGRHHVFFEDFSAQDERGVISRLEILPDGSTTAPETVLARPYHLSYPFLFAIGNEIYMLPETASNQAIELYRADAFPTKWRYERTLIKNVTAVDPTILDYAGKLWLFANVREYGAPYSDELYVYFAESLDGPWTPHSRNPVVSDVQSARPAGRIFEHCGALIRPGQDSSGRYGRAVVLNRVDVLTARDYRETPVGRIDSSWRSGNLGTHTYNFDDLYEVVDGREWEPRWEDLRIGRRRRRLGAIRQNDT